MARTTKASTNLLHQWVSAVHILISASRTLQVRRVTSCEPVCTGVSHLAAMKASYAVFGVGVLLMNLLSLGELRVM